MHLQSEDGRLTQVLEQIAALDLAPIKFKLSSKEDGYGWTPEHLDRVEHGYRRFLALLAMHPGRQFAPSRDIDKFWHAHILDTRKYAIDCEAIFGGFLHHNPYLGMLGDMDALQQAAQSMHSLYESEFGEEVPDNANVIDDTAVAAFCGGDVPAGRAAAFYGGDAPAAKAAAFCGGDAPAAKAAAFCGGDAPVVRAVAFCGGDAPAAKAAAFCGGDAPAAKAAAFCGGDAPAAKAAAFCGGDAPAAKSAAFCGGDAPLGRELVFCGGEVLVAH